MYSIWGKWPVFPIQANTVWGDEWVCLLPEIMYNLTAEEQLDDTHCYMDNLIVAGQSQQQHDNNVQKISRCSSTQEVHAESC